ncbi:MAG: diguanylate cyclase [Planctomycetota bacterium]
MYPTLEDVFQPTNVRETVSPPMATKQPRILVIEDDLDTADLVLETLQDFFGTGCCTHVSSATKAKAVDTEAFDLVLSDMNLPDGNGLEIMQHLLDRRPDLPIVFVTGENILANAIEAIRNGAYDYVVKAGDYLFSIPVVVEKNLELWRIKSDNERLQARLAETLEEVNIKNEQLRQAVDRLETVAATDPLTGLANRRSLNESMEQRFAESLRGGQDFAILMMDLDGFKGLNDNAGHPAGDQVLVAAADVIRANCRRSDVPGRFGGDEFIVILPNTDPEEAVAVGKRIMEDFQHSARRVCANVQYDGTVTMSMGLSTRLTGQSANPEQLVARADQALYSAKAKGKHRLEIDGSSTRQVA